MTWIKATKRMSGAGYYFRRIGACAAICAGLSGCAGTGNDNTTIPASAQVDTYVGTSPASGTFGGVWGMTIDHTTNYFNLIDTGYDGSFTINYIGNLSEANQFESLDTTYSNYPFANVTPIYGVEVPGDTAFLQLIDQGAPAVFAESNGCQPFTSPTTFQLLELGIAGSGEPELQAYGTVTVNAAQTNWTFSNFDLLQINGTDDKPAALADGACSLASEGYVTTIPATLDGQPIVYSVAISPNGYFIMDRGKTDFSNQNQEVLSPLVGVIQPSSPLNTSSLMAANYVGFEYDAGDESPQIPAPKSATIQPVYFSGSNATQTQMVGGTFPNGDPTQTPGTDIDVNLGTQSPSQNGLYPSVAVTIPDPSSECATTPYAGTSASGSPTCTFPAVAVAGNPNGKYALFISMENPIIRAQGNSAYPIQFLLYPQ
jgi:hypothetical protein